MANIYRDGVCVYSVNIDEVYEPYELTFSENGDENVVRIEHGKICIISANCPDKVCVKSGWLSDGLMPVVCLPHKLVIKIEKEAAEVSDEIDAVAK